MTAWLEGHLQRVLWYSERSGYAVVRILAGENLVTAVGELAILAEDPDAEGTFVVLEGAWEEHKIHGSQFRATGFLQSLPRTLDGMKSYLGSCGIPGVGEALAERIVKHFGASTLTVLANEPKRLTEVTGIGKSRADAIATRWAADEAGRALIVRLRGLGLSPRLIDRIRRVYGGRAATIVAREPYRLAEEIPGIGFRTADALAREQGLPPDAIDRVRAAVLHALDQAKGEGHCFLPRRILRDAVAKLAVPTEQLDKAIASAEFAGRILVEPREPNTEDPHDEDAVWPLKLHVSETEVAQALGSRVALDLDAQIALLETEEERNKLRLEVEQAERFVGTTLDDLQRRAVEMALRGGLVVITGGPGTGKTTLLRVLLRAVKERGQKWLLASPTGRASRRMAEATGEEAATIHRMLEYNPNEGGFQRHTGKPLEGDGLVVDEASMMDLPLMEALLAALPADGKRPFSVVLVGDVDQLPSVGPGQVLRDVIDSTVVPVIRLERIYRQGPQSGIVQAAASIRQGSVPQSGERAGYQDCFLLPRMEPEAVLQTVLTVVKERLPRHGLSPMEDIQVLTPTRKGPLGTGALNKALQECLNPDGQAVKRGQREFRKGDRVLCTRNRYDVEVFNGDVGRVVGVAKEGLEVDFDGRVLPWGWEDLSLLDLAYAMTIHKSQGSEYAAVVMVLHHSHGIMLRRNLFYTGVTRASRFLCVVGSPRAWGRSVKHTGGDERYTSLAARIRGG